MLRVKVCKSNKLDQPDYYPTKATVLEPSLLICPSSLTIKTPSVLLSRDSMPRTCKHSPLRLPCLLNPFPTNKQLSLEETWLEEERSLQLTISLSASVILSSREPGSARTTCGLCFHFPAVQVIIYCVSFPAAFSHRLRRKM